MKLCYLGEVIHGVTLSRIEPNLNEKSKSFKLFTMQDLNKETGKYDLVTEEQEVLVDVNKFNEEMLSKKGEVVIGLTSFKATVIEENHEHKIIPSNFAIVDFDNNKLDPYYFTWLFNENPRTKNQLITATQGSIIRAVNIQMLRELEIPTPSLEIQRKIGKVYKLRRRKEKLIFEKSILEDKLYRQLIINNLREE